MNRLVANDDLYSVTMLCTLQFIKGEKSTMCAPHIAGGDTPHIESTRAKMVGTKSLVLHHLIIYLFLLNLLHWRSKK